jgi:hypothetical protein
MTVTTNDFIGPLEAVKSEFSGLDYSYLLECYNDSVDSNNSGLVRRLYIELTARPEWSA